MKKLLSILVLLNFVATLVLPDILQASANRFKIYNLAVLNIKPKGDLNADDALLLTSELERRLGEINFIQTLSINSFQRQSGNYCTSLRCALKKGKSLGADFIVYGVIQQVGDYFACDFRMANIAAGKLVGSASYKFDGDLEVVLDQMKNIGRKLVGLRTSVDMPLSRRSLAQAKKAQKRKNRDFRFSSSNRDDKQKPLQKSTPGVYPDANRGQSGSASDHAADHSNSLFTGTNKTTGQTKKPVARENSLRPSQSEEYLDSITWDTGEESPAAVQKKSEKKQESESVSRKNANQSEASFLNSSATAAEKKQRRETEIQPQEKEDATQYDKYYDDDYSSEWGDEFTAQNNEQVKNTEDAARTELSKEPELTAAKQVAATSPTVEKSATDDVVDDFDGVDFLDSPAPANSEKDSVQTNETVNSISNNSIRPVEEFPKPIAQKENDFLTNQTSASEENDAAALPSSPAINERSTKTIQQNETTPAIQEPVKLIEITWDDKQNNETDTAFDDYTIAGDDEYSPLTSKDNQDGFLKDNLWSDYKTIKPAANNSSRVTTTTRKNKSNLQGDSNSVDDGLNKSTRIGTANKINSSADSISEIFPAYSAASQNSALQGQQDQSVASEEVTNDDDGFPQAEFLSGTPNKEEKTSTEKPARQFKIGKWGLYGLLATGVGTGIIIAAKNLGKPDGPGNNGTPLPTPPEFLGGN